MEYTGQVVVMSVLDLC